eukprot:TRINITY_DN60076_c0_g1_i1.p2 TRINITY_DN60076_c0_g1~~TRINITY_DN60076_c0_g1_i1.p2  ORF type:complete len:151 (+),score=36.45 TRINITY_DN60076_c0_g1_i1:300-752(+)
MQAYVAFCWVLLSLAAGADAGCKETSTDALPICGVDGMSIYRCNCPWYSCSGDNFLTAKCEETPELAVLVTFCVVTFLVIVIVGSWACCCKGPGCTCTRCCQGGCCCQPNAVYAAPVQQGYAAPPPEGPQAVQVFAQPVQGTVVKNDTPR